MDKPSLELLKCTTEQEWLEYLRHADSCGTLSTNELKSLWYLLTQAAISDFMKIDPIQVYMKDYNRMKVAFDIFAKEKSLPKWREGTTDDEWMSP